MSIKTRETEIGLRVINPEADVYLTITIGNAQIGGTVVKYEDNILAKGKIKNLNLGRGSALSGRTILSYTNVLDVNEQTNGVVITYYFHNCEPDVMTLSDKVDNHGDIFSFITYLNFN